jgi:hypothetical protein
VCAILHALSNVRILYPEAIMPVWTIIEPFKIRSFERFRQWRQETQL